MIALLICPQPYSAGVASDASYVNHAMYPSRSGSGDPIGYDWKIVKSVARIQDRSQLGKYFKV